MEKCNGTNGDKNGTRKENRNNFCLEDHSFGLYKNSGIGSDKLLLIFSKSFDCVEKKREILAFPSSTALGTFVSGGPGLPSVCETSGS